MLPEVSFETKPLINLWFQVQHYPFWTNLACACKTETLGSLYSHALLILTKTRLVRLETGMVIISLDTHPEIDSAKLFMEK